MALLATEYGGGSKPVDIIFAGGEYRRLPRYDHDPQVTARMFLAYGDRDSEPMIDEADWKEVDWSRYVGPIKDQDGKGACLLYATAKGLEFCRAVAGLEPILLNAMQAYGVIRYPQDGGSDFPEVLQHLVNVGFIPETVLPDDPDNWNPAKSPANWKTIAADLRALEVRDCPTRKHVGSALQRGLFVVAGVSVTAAFEPDANGIIRPYKPGQLNHGIGFCGSKKIDGEWYHRLVNSWSLSWGDNGCAWFPQSSLPASCPCFAVRAPVMPPLDKLFK